MCLRKGGDIFAVFEKLVRGINAFEKKVRRRAVEERRRDKG